MCTEMNGFKFDFSKIFWGGAHRAPSPDPSPRFFSSFALGSGFALNSRALRALDSGFALDTRALRALDSGFALNFGLGTLVWPPQNKFLDPPLRVRYYQTKKISVRLYVNASLNERFIANSILLKSHNKN